MTKATPLLAALFALAAGPALAEGPKWQPLAYSDSRHPGPDQARLDALWGGQVAGAPFARYLFGRVELGDGRSAFVSMASTPDICEPAANSDTATNSTPVCPVKVELTGPGGSKVTLEGSACISAALPEEGAEAAARNRTEVAVEPGAILLRAMNDGRYPEDCLDRVPVPAP